MAAAGGSGQENRGSGGSQEQAEVADSPAKEFMEKLRKSQEEIPSMGMAEVLAYQEEMRALRLSVLQRIKELEEKAAATDPEQATAAPEPRRGG